MQLPTGAHELYAVFRGAGVCYRIEMLKIVGRVQVMSTERGGTSQSYFLCSNALAPLLR